MGKFVLGALNAALAVAWGALATKYKGKTKWIYFACSILYGISSVLNFIMWAAT